MLAINVAPCGSLMTVIRTQGASKGGTITEAAPGVLGLPDQAPFDRILVSAEATELPDELVAQLGEGGRLVIPVSGVILAWLFLGESLELDETLGMALIGLGLVVIDGRTLAALRRQPA